jgi:hypothetical protein
MRAAYNKYLLYACESKPLQCPIQQRGIADRKKTLASRFRLYKENGQRA